METVDDADLNTTIREALRAELDRQAVVTIAELDLGALAGAIEVALLVDDDDGIELDDLSAANDG